MSLSSIFIIFAAAAVVVVEAAMVVVITSLGMNLCLEIVQFSCLLKRCNARMDRRRELWMDGLRELQMDGQT